MKKLLKFKSSINFKLLVTSLSFLAISTIAFFACTKQNSSSNSQSDDHIVQSFLQSQTFSRHREFIETLGSISYKDIKAATLNVNDKDSFNVLNIPINKNGRKVGYIEVVDLKNTKYFPNNDTYALNYVDLKNFDTKSLTGNVEMIDLNYDNFVHSRISIENNNIIKWNSNGLSSELSLKYQTIKKPKALTFPSMRSGITIGVNNKITTLRLPIYTLCDSNGDNNISFSECYKCASDAVTANGFSSFVCDFPLLGWLSCWGSKTAACIYISAKY